MALTQPTESKTLARIVTEDFRATQVFEKYGLDYYCKGKRQLIQACLEMQIPVTHVVNELDLISVETNHSNRFKDWSIEFLAEYIVQQHHSYVRTKIPLIQGQLQKVVNAQTEKSSAISEIQDYFGELSAILLHHLLEEEATIFPLIKVIVLTREFNMCEEFLEKDLEVHAAKEDFEHKVIVNLLETIQKWTNNYNPVQGASSTLISLYKELRAFQEDMFHHIHLENNILFPRVLDDFDQGNRYLISNN